MRPLMRSLGGAVRLNEQPGDHRARQPFIDAWRVNEADLRAALVTAADQPSQLNELLYLLNVWDEMRRSTASKQPWSFSSSHSTCGAGLVSVVRALSKPQRPFSGCSNAPSLSPPPSIGGTDADSKSTDGIRAGSSSF